MMSSENSINPAPQRAAEPNDDRSLTTRLRCGIVVRVREDVCQISVGGDVHRVGYARHLPSPRTERIAPGHLVAVTDERPGMGVVVWRWYDAVVVDDDDDDDGAADVGDGDGVTLWEPAHGEVRATRRPAYVPSLPGARVYLSAGLPGADWWVAGPVVTDARDARVELDEVERLYTEHGLWDDLV